MFNIKKTKDTENKIALDKLVHFDNHPFTLYSDERFEELVASVEQLGVIQPIIVRKKDEMYEILAGHNRTEACKKLGLEEIPAVIVDVTDEEAEMIVIETNLQQRSFSDLPTSEKAKVISIRHSAMKSQGKRRDLIKNVEAVLKDLEVIQSNKLFENKENKKDNTTSSVVGSEYGLSKGSVARYLRIAKLTKKLLTLVDIGVIGIRAGVELSYISKENQDLIYTSIITNNYKIDLEKSKFLRKLDSANKLYNLKIDEILNGVIKTVDSKKDDIKKKDITMGIVEQKIEDTENDKTVYTKKLANASSEDIIIDSSKKEPLKITSDTYITYIAVVQKYFTSNQTEDEVTDIIDKALALYFKKKE